MPAPAIPPASAHPSRPGAALPHLYRPEEVAEALGCSAWWVKDRARRGLIPHARIGRSYRFSDAHLAEIVRMNEERPDPQPHRPQRPSGPAAPRVARPQDEGAPPTVRLRARPPRRMLKSQYETTA
ncbi:helix-turn-helix domain-containing protein [Streptomyces chiangmaiensis]|uniref:Helix-turn-helix domain-containing protein n=1 Tax=Streptomyces chiangmaiensis TaxID=766497 RepID=A0ABU7FJ42_9ACTN|nr:helix-turn-helix domain-containing protein [Streptomyces chiangmaiensis]MED7823838.1 helix-turn-helix domain-containing protein [Streptomyces chiangmaiensis]